jgi:hypothetical protein
MVEGALGARLDHRRRGSDDPVGDAVELGHCLDGRDPHHRHALRLEPRVTAAVALLPILRIVTLAVSSIASGGERLRRSFRAAAIVVVGALIVCGFPLHRPSGGPPPPLRRGG